MKCLFLVTLWLELGLTDGSTSQLDVQGPLECVQNLLVRLGCASLVLAENVGCCVTLLGQLVAGHLGLQLVALLLDQLADLDADSLGLDDIWVVVELLLTLTLCVTLGL